MKSEDPIEELFRKRSKDAVGEKPRDLVWKRIETGLQNDEKKKKPLREFISSVWFSAAVFALIAIPYFIFFVENLNTENSSIIEVVKKNNPLIIKNDDDQLEIIDVKELDDVPTPIVKNEEKNKSPYSSISKDETPSIVYNRTEESSNDQKISDKLMLRTYILDSIEKNELLATQSKSRKNCSKDSLKVNESKGGIEGYSLARNSNQNKALDTNPNSTNLVPQPLAASTPMKSSKEAVNIDAEITYKPLKFIARTDILRTIFKLQSKSKNKISFVNKNVVVSFEKTNGQIILRTNEPKMSKNLVNILEINKKEIYSYYQNK